MNKTISVINQTPMKVIAETKSDTYIFEPHYTENNIQDLIIDEINYINKNSQLFKEGYLTVSDKEKEQVFDEIGFKNWQNVLSLEEIIDAIENPTGEKLAKLLSIRSLNAFNRVHKELTGMLSVPNNILNRVIELIEYRYDELAMGKLDTSIELEPKDTQPVKTQEQLEKEMEEMRKLVAELTKKVEKDNDNKESKKEVVDEKPQKKINKNRKVE